MSRALRLVKEYRLTVILSGLVTAILLLTFIPASQTDFMVVDDTIAISSDQTAQISFTYSGKGVDQNMSLGCKIPAYIKVQCKENRAKGSIDIHINDLKVAYATVTGTGEVLLSSGCGCSTSCVCQILVGENILKIVSHGFFGQLRYQIYVETDTR